MVKASVIQRAILSCSATALCLAFATSAHAVDFTRICSLYGGGYYYMPGTDICANAMTGITKQATPSGIVVGKTEYLQTAERAVTDARHAARLAFNALTGAAVAASLPDPDVPAGRTYAFSGSFGTYDGYSALGFGGAIRMSPGLNLSAAAGSSLDQNAYGVRVALNFKW